MLDNIRIIISLLPYLLTLIKSVEEVLPESGKGREKLVFVKETLMAIIPDIVNIWPVIEKIITSIVTLYNTTGIFKKA